MELAQTAPSLESTESNRAEQQAKLRASTEALRLAAQRFAPRLVMATAFGMEGCTLIDIIGRNELPVDIFTLDTGLFFAETYELWNQLEKRYGLKIRAVRPELSVAEQAGRFGEALWNREPDRCCEMRKVAPLRAALAAADAVERDVRRIPGVSAVQVCGSVRRGSATSKDVDVVARLGPGADREAVLGAFQRLGEKLDGRSIRVAALGMFVQVDLWIVEEWHYGAAVVYATGSKDHCVALRTLAKSRGLTLNEYGLFPAGTGDFSRASQSAPASTEEEVYSSLGLRYFAPEERDGDLSK